MNTFSIGWVGVVTIGVGILELFLSRYVLKVLPEKGVGALPWTYLCRLWYWKQQAPPDESRRIPASILNAQSLEEVFTLLRYKF
jgi:hypothetical protein